MMNDILDIFSYNLLKQKGRKGRKEEKENPFVQNKKVKAARVHMVCAHGVFGRCKRW
jgi:hypothetical protein